MGIDVGSHKVGVAIGGPPYTSATPVTTLYRESRGAHEQTRGMWVQLKQFIELKKAAVCVLGMPLRPDGLMCANGKERSTAFGLGLQAALGDHIPVVYWDERWSSVNAKQRMRQEGIRAANRDRMIDGFAACVILDGFFRGLQNPALAHSMSQMEHVISKNTRSHALYDRDEDRQERQRQWDRKSRRGRRKK